MSILYQKILSYSHVVKQQIIITCLNICIHVQSSYIVDYVEEAEMPVCSQQQPTKSEKIQCSHNTNTSHIFWKKQNKILSLQLLHITELNASLFLSLRVVERHFGNQHLKWELIGLGDSQKKCNSWTCWVTSFFFSSLNIFVFRYSSHAVDCWSWMNALCSIMRSVNYNW